MSSLILNFTNRVIEVKKQALTILNQFDPKLFSFEQGGILLGEIFNDKIIISEIITPSNLDRNGRFFFIRSKNNAQAIINDYWDKSNGKINYLGEWHTHYQQHPLPSIQDDRTMKKIINKTLTELDFTILIIKGKNTSLWIGEYRKEGLTEYAQVNYLL